MVCVNHLVCVWQQTSVFSYLQQYTMPAHCMSSMPFLCCLLCHSPHWTILWGTTPASKPGWQCPCIVAGLPLVIRWGQSGRSFLTRFFDLEEKIFIVSPSWSLKTIHWSSKWNNLILKRHLFWDTHPLFWDAATQEGDPLTRWAVASPPLHSTSIFDQKRGLY